MNRTGHPDWVKMFGDSNGQIKLRAKQKFNFLSATVCYSIFFLFSGNFIILFFQIFFSFLAKNLLWKFLAVFSDTEVFFFFR